MEAGLADHAWTLEEIAALLDWGLDDIPHGVYDGFMTRKTARTPLRVSNEAFVPDEPKAEVRKRLARLKGQIEGVERMLEQNRPCVEILTQISAAQEALRGAGRVIVRNYLEKCASTAIREGREQEVYDEVMDLVFRVSR
jgi:DNA-binding FrmR family transcriptional regulator